MRTRAPSRKPNEDVTKLLASLPVQVRAAGRTPHPNASLTPRHPSLSFFLCKNLWRGRPPERCIAGGTEDGNAVLMDKSLFRYIWTHSKRDQLIVCSVVLASQPFYFMSLDLPRQIVNEAIQGKAFQDGRMTAPFLRIAFDWPAWLGGGTTSIFEGFQVGRIGLLLGLSCLFLVF